MNDDIKNAINILAKKIDDQTKAGDALQYTQAALNLAHTAITLGNLDRQES